MNPNPDISELLARLEKLSQTAEKQQREIQLLRQEIRRLASHSAEEESPEKKPETSPVRRSPVTSGSEDGRVFRAPGSKPAPPVRTASPPRRSLEEYIGGNLINKIGIFILVLGLGIFLNYAIENNLIGPAMRVVLGAAAGLLLVGLAYRLKKNYQAYSAVLLSGGVATLYFSTYAAYDFYGLLPHAAAFVLMLGVTVFTVYAAMQFDQQVIGVIGQAGAYAVPLLLSQGSGKVAVLFAYIAIINGGIVWVAFRKKWLLMNLAAFVLTWLTYGIWFGLGFEPEKHRWIALGFGLLYFLMFYAVLAFYQMPDATLQRRNTFFLLLNAGLFFLFGYLALHDQPYENWRGPFTIGLALLNGAVAGLFRERGWSEPLYYIALALAITFLTTAIPVQFSETPVTFLWAAEAAVLYWISTRSRAGWFASFAVGLVVLATFSVLNGWQVYNSFTNAMVARTFLLNETFLATVWVVAMQIAIKWLNWKFPVAAASTNEFFKTALPVLSGLLLYGGLMLEIGYYFDYQYSVTTGRNTGINAAAWSDFNYLKVLWQISFSALYAAVLTGLVIRLSPGKNWALGILGFSVVVLVWWLVEGLAAAANLRESYINGVAGASPLFIWIRYIVYACIAIALLAGGRLMGRTALTKENPLVRVFTISIHLFVLAVLSAELLQLSLWLGRGDVESRKQWAQKVGFSVLWGLYALGLVARGFSQKRKLLRIMGIVLFGITLVKLFAFDLSNIPTLGKIVAFVGLGVLLLVISFLYQKYKDVLLAGDEGEGENREKAGYSD